MTTTPDDAHQALVMSSLKMAAEKIGPEMLSFFGILGESPEAWRGAVMFAAGIMATLTEGPEKKRSLPDVLADITVMTAMLLEHPQAQHALRTWVEEHRGECEGCDDDGGA